MLSFMLQHVIDVYTKVHGCVMEVLVRFLFSYYHLSGGTSVYQSLWLCDGGFAGILFIHYHISSGISVYQTPWLCDGGCAIFYYHINSGISIYLTPWLCDGGCATLLLLYLIREK